MKFITVCAVGFCRSVAAKRWLEKRGHEARARGGMLPELDGDALKMDDLDWADHVIAILPGGEKAVMWAEQKKKPLTIIHLEDVWGFPERAQATVNRIMLAKARRGELPIKVS